MRLRVDASRARTRTAVRVIAAVTVAMVAGLLLLNRSYLQPYDSLGGQAVLGCVFAIFAAGLGWLQVMSRYQAPDRFLARRNRRTSRDPAHPHAGRSRHRPRAVDPRRQPAPPPPLPRRGHGTRRHPRAARRPHRPADPHGWRWRSATPSASTGSSPTPSAGTCASSTAAPRTTSPAASSPASSWAPSPPPSPPSSPSRASASGWRCPPGSPSCSPWPERCCPPPPCTPKRSAGGAASNTPSAPTSTWSGSTWPPARASKGPWRRPPPAGKGRRSPRSARRSTGPRSPAKPPGPASTAWARNSASPSCASWPPPSAWPATSAPRSETPWPPRPRTLRSRGLAEIEEAANSANERMSLPVVLLVVAFIVFIGYPAVFRIIHGL